MFYERFEHRTDIISSRYKECQGVVDSAEFQRTVDRPKEFAPGYHVVLDSGRVVTARWDQVKTRFLEGVG